jgi:uncharacterized XkdX family phage protein
MDWYETIKTFYKWGNYDEEDVMFFVEYGKITLEEAQRIINGEE